MSKMRCGACGSSRTIEVAWCDNFRGGIIVAVLGMQCAACRFEFVTPEQARRNDLLIQEARANLQPNANKEQG